MPRGKEPCPTKSHPQSPRLARLVPWIPRLFPGDQQNVPGYPVLARAREKTTTIPRRVKGTARTHTHTRTHTHVFLQHHTTYHVRTWSWFQKEPCRPRTNGCLLYAAPHPPSTAGSCSPPSATLPALERCSPAAPQPGPGPAAATAAAALGRVLVSAAEPGQQLARPRVAVLRPPESIQHAGCHERIHLRRLVFFLLSFPSALCITRQQHSSDILKRSTRDQPA